MSEVATKREPFRILVGCRLCGARRGFQTNQNPSLMLFEDSMKILAMFSETIARQCQYIHTLHHDGVHDAFNCVQIGCLQVEKMLSDVEEIAVVGLIEMRRGMNGGEAGAKHA